MKLNRRSLLAGIGGSGVSFTFVGVASAGNVKRRYLVRISNEAAERRLRRKGYSVVDRLAGGSVVVVTGEEDSSDEIAGTTDVREAVPDFSFELEGPEKYELHEEDDGTDDGNGHKGNGGNGDSQDDEDGTDEDPTFLDLQWDKFVTDALDAHDSATGAGSRLAIIDTGIDHTHPDLANVNTDLSLAFVEGGEENDHTGDVSYHGTHVAGITAATGEVGVVGTAPGAELVSIRVFAEEGGAFFSDILRAIEYAADIGADAANMSIGTPPIPPQANAAQYRRIMEPVAQRASKEGTLLVGSAGNSDANLQQGGFFTLPNSLSGVASISATSPNDKRTFYSNYGTNEIDVGAPGGGYETLEKTLEEDDDEVDWPYPYNLVLNAIPGGWAWLAGTSMAAPQVTGTAGLVREVDPEANTDTVERAIKAGADLVDGEGDEEFGAGRLNAADSVDEA